LVSREFGRIDAADSRLREFFTQQRIVPSISSILTLNQGLGPFGILGRPNKLLRRLLVLRHLRRIRHRAHRTLARTLHLLLAHQRLRNVHLAAALEPGHHGHSHRPRDPVPRRRVLRPLPQRHQRSEARRPGALGQWPLRRLEAHWCSC
jgi:hypothetical protein